MAQVVGLADGLRIPGMQVGAYAIKVQINQCRVEIIDTGIVDSGHDAPQV